MAYVNIELCPCDQGHYGSTYYHCSECWSNIKSDNDPVCWNAYLLKNCPKCGIKFDEKPKTTISSGFGGSDF